MDRHWTDVDTYFEQELLGEDPVLDAVLDANRRNGLRPIDVSPLQGRLLELLVRLSGARNILEIGTLGGYSTICMARGLPSDGRIVTLESEALHAATARANFERADVAARIDIRIGPAADSLPLLVHEGRGPFDFVFIDADKPGNPIYIDWALKLSRPGTVIVCDNVVRNGAVVDAANSDPGVLGSRRAIEMFGADPRLRATALQTVGSKGYDGFAIALVR